MIPMIRALLVDDEEDSIEILETLLQEHCSDVTVVSTARNALQAVHAIHSEQPDVVFLDVQMPGHNGFDVLETVSENPALVVFTTAHKDYAIAALRKGAFDYLLKPIDTLELTGCMERIRKRLEKNGAPGTRYGIIELAMKEGSIFVQPSEIVRLEAAGNYTYFHLDGGVKHLVSKSIKEYEAQLDSAVFYRCHKTHAVNLRKVRRFHLGDYCVELSDGSRIEIARKKKEELLERLKSLEL
jgi:two-component system, LytTR family, response regulator